MEKDKELSRIFRDNKKEFADEGFSRSVTAGLPSRDSLMPLIVIFVSFTVSVVLFWLLGGFESLLRQIGLFAEAVNVSQMPPLSSIITLAVWLSLSGLLGYSVTPYLSSGNP